MRRHQLAFAVILLPLDYLALLAAALTAYRLRFETFVELRPAISLLPYPEFLKAATLVALGYLFVFAITGLYSIERPRRILEEAVRVVSACTLAAMGLIILIFFRRELFTSRFVVLAAWLLSFAYVIAARLLVRAVNRSLLKRGIGARRTLIVGDGPSTDILEGTYAGEPELGYRVVRRFRRWDEAASREASALCQRGAVDELFMAEPEADKASMRNAIEFAEDRHLIFRYAADTLAARAELLPTTVAGIPVIEVKRTRLDGWGRVYKRVFDVVSSLALIALTSPFMLLAALAVKLTSRGPVIFKNERVGLEGQTFRVYKFRTMRAEVSIGEQFGDQEAALAYERRLIAERGLKEGPVYKMPADDPRITPIGRILRRFSIDELPQFFNVLKGEMSLVGPRPHQPREVEKYERHHRRVLGIRPGITGLAQVSGRRDLAFEDEVRLDTFYIENWTPLMDVAILFKTPMAVFSKKGAY